ncbi:MACRO domain containing protein 1 [Pyrenophora tritici-repentis]|nr:MACRO domain containing protein 1 [Pyrenophora tritici-repentis]KAI0574453.1 MACRO domain-containing protein 1 [Pyrenophora tritici-repentis]
MIDIIDNLYKLSVRIRTPSIRSRSLKASSYMQKDPETGVDVLSMYAELDLKHVQELLSDLRRSFPNNEEMDKDFLIVRLSKSITLRRRNFKYWKRHRDKLGAATGDELFQAGVIVTAEEPGTARNDTLEAQPAIPLITTRQEAPSQKTGRTFLSGTEATQHHQSLDDIVDTKSVTSYAVTVKDLHGKAVSLPPPPQTANGEKDFECPYCWIVCPARYGNSRAWKTHLLQDLQPYCCTYPDCESSEQLFRSRREWAEHEASHRKVWRCPEHSAAMYNSQTGLENHFRHQHPDSFSEIQLLTAVKVGETTTIDMREQCPICYAPADMEGLGDFHSHIANHLERIATFALPHSRDDDEDGTSGVASRGSSNSQYLPSSLPTRTTDKHDDREETEHGILQLDEPSDSLRMVNPSHALLSTESLQQLPDESQNRLQMIPKLLNTSHEEEGDPSDTWSDDEPSVDIQNHSSRREASTPEIKRSRKDQIISVANIPSLRSLYITGQIIQRDQSYAPNVFYNQLISFIHHDLTRLKVDAIVNNAPTDLSLSPANNTLHSAIFKAAGPGLTEEAKLKADIKVGQVGLTQGHDLPSSWIIHAAGLKYNWSKGYDQFKVLSSCYQSALEMATYHGIKTIAFPCLGTGGCGFPARVAARIALQEIRDYLDSHPKHGLERIVICVKTDFDKKAYMSFFPVFFPPTHGDLDRARTAELSVDGARPAAQVLDSRAQVQKAVTGLQEVFGSEFPNMKTDYFEPLRSTEFSLTSIYDYISRPQERARNFDDVMLLCSVTTSVCGTIAEMTETAKNTENTERVYQRILGETNNQMRVAHGHDLDRFLNYVHVFAECLTTTPNKKTFKDFKLRQVRKILKEYGAKGQTQDTKDGRDYSDDILFSQQYQQENASSRHRNVIGLQQIPSVARLFRIGDLEAKPTLAHPSETFNHMVCLVREDIMKLEVDIMVNSTDSSFLGMGVLDRSVFKKGGPELMEQIKKFGTCNEGDVKVTPGYLLPAKHILHAIPPEQFSKSNKGILRNIYREILHTAVLLKATSIAIPSIGTGRLNYPRRDCASLAMEEVKRFLESADPNNTLEKIIFVVYSSNDEFVYKSLLPVYFPLPQHNAYTPVQFTMQPPDIQGDPSSPKRTSTDPVSLLASLSGEHHVVRLGNQSETWRSINSDEEEALIRFESHARSCIDCKDISGLYEIEQGLCKKGYRLAQAVVHYLQMSPDEDVYSSGARNGKRDKLNIPADMFPISLILLQTVEKSTRDGEQGKPFVESLSLPTRILAYLTDDLKVRPGSYIGQHIKEIAAALGADQEDVTPALIRLAKYGAVHNTLDKDTWVISQQVTDHPILQENRSVESRESKLDPALAEKLMKWTESSHTPQTMHQLDSDPQVPSVSVSVTPKDAKDSAENEDDRPHSTPTYANAEEVVNIGANTQTQDKPVEKEPTVTNSYLCPDFQCDKVFQSSAARLHHFMECHSLSETEHEDALAPESETKPELDPALAESIMSYMVHMSRTPLERQGQTVRQLAAALQVPTRRIWPAIRYLSAMGLIYRPSDSEYRPSDAETWAVSLTASDAVHDVDKIIHAVIENNKESEGGNGNSNTNPAISPYVRIRTYLKEMKGGRMPMSNLAARLAIPITVVMLALQRLRDEGLVENEGDPFWWAATTKLVGLRDGE